MALVKFVDDAVGRSIGFVWVNSPTPVTVASDAGYVPLIAIDQQSMPFGENFPNPWQLKWKMVDVDVPSGEVTFDALTPIENHNMALIIQTSPDNTTWTDYKSMGLTLVRGMVGRFQYNIVISPVVPRYIRVVARIYPKKDGTVTHALMIMGIENWLLNA